MNAISPKSLLIESGLDWQAIKVPTYFNDPISGEQHATGKQALVRSTDLAVLSPNVGPGWEPIQNATALDFFDEFCTAGEMEMESAGALCNGKYVYAYAKIDEAFELPGRDLVEAKLLFCNPQIVGRSAGIFFTPRRFVCLNPLPMLFSSKNKFRHIHTAKFVPEEAKLAMGLSKDMFKTFEQQARLLAGKRAKPENVVEYFQTLFPNAVDAANENQGQSRRALLCAANYESQPGAEMSEGSWWHAFNTVTYVTDHVLGRSEDKRQANAWFGWTRQRKQEALGLALKMAA